MSFFSIHNYEKLINFLENSFATLVGTKNSFIVTGFVMVHSVTVSYLHVAATRLSKAINFHTVDVSLERQIPDIVETTMSAMRTFCSYFLMIMCWVDF